MARKPIKLSKLAAAELAKAVKAAPVVRKAVKAAPVVRKAVKAAPVVRKAVKAAPVVRKAVKAAPAPSGGGIGGGIGGGKRGKGKANRNWVSMGFKIHELPKGVSKAEFFSGLKRAVIAGRLPDGWNIEWQWRNRPNGPLLTGAFEKTIRESRGGWKDLMLLTIGNKEHRA
jgi:hypothetical protein